mmetsp:Transcript_6654/g.19148  ORF Transcript_6654/g.19148 Transcript_6654/m.19148 type:complete len:320 (-) Transcript_6654:264-1223(-)
MSGPLGVDNHQAAPFLGIHQVVPGLEQRPLGIRQIVEGGAKDHGTVLLSLVFLGFGKKVRGSKAALGGNIGIEGLGVTDHFLRQIDAVDLIGLEPRLFQKGHEDAISTPHVEDQAVVIVVVVVAGSLVCHLRRLGHAVLDGSGHVSRHRPTGLGVGARVPGNFLHRDLQILRGQLVGFHVFLKGPAVLDGGFEFLRAVTLANLLRPHSGNPALEHLHDFPELEGPPEGLGQRVLYQERDSFLGAGGNVFRRGSPVDLFHLVGPSLLGLRRGFAGALGLGLIFALLFALGRLGSGRTKSRHEQRSNLRGRCRGRRRRCGV